MLKQLAAGEIDTKIEHFEIGEFDGYLSEMMHSYPYYFREIPPITFSDDKFDFETYEDLFRTDNLTEINLDCMDEYDTYHNDSHFNHLPANLEIQTIKLRNIDAMFKKLPDTIKVLSVSWMWCHELDET